MKFKIEFQYKGTETSRPYSEIPDDEIVFKKKESIPIPNVGDTVSYLSADRMQFFKVVSRHFSYLVGWCVVNIVVTDVASDEKSVKA